MVREKKFAKHFDLAHSLMFSEYPSQYTKALGVPGEFVKKINRRVHLKNGSTGKMDSAYIADPDDEILFERVATALEHQSTPVSDSKLSKIGDYDIQLVADENLPTFIVVASHLNEEKSKNLLKRSPSDITKPYFLDLGKENITKRLNTVSRIINTNQHLSIENALNLGIIVLYTQRDQACENTEKVVNLYLKISTNLDFKMEYILYSIITIMIDAYFDDENKYKELINMMDNNTSKEIKQKFESEEFIYEDVKFMEENMNNMKKDLTEANNTIQEQNNKIEEKNNTIQEQNDKIEEKDKKLEKANGKIADLEAEIQILKEKTYGK